MSMEKERQDLFIEQFYHEMYIQLFIYARSALNDSSLAEEAVQETFRIACMKTDELMSSANPKGWIMNTLKNVIRNTRRTHARSSNVVLGSNAFDEKIMGAITDEIDPELLYADIIAKEDLKLLKQVVLERYPLVEVAGELGIPVEACKKRVQRVKKKYKKILQEDSKN